MYSWKQGHYNKRYFHENSITTIDNVSIETTSEFFFSFCKLTNLRYYLMYPWKQGHYNKQYIHGNNITTIDNVTIETTSESFFHFVN